MAPHTWSHLGDTVSDTTHHMYYRGQKIKEAYYRGEKIWGDDSSEPFYIDVTTYHYTPYFNNAYYHPNPSPGTELQDGNHMLNSWDYKWGGMQTSYIITHTVPWLDSKILNDDLLVRSITIRVELPFPKWVIAQNPHLIKRIAIGRKRLLGVYEYTASSSSGVSTGVTYHSYVPEILVDIDCNITVKRQSEKNATISLHSDTINLENITIRKPKTKIIEILAVKPYPEELIREDSDLERINSIIDEKYTNFDAHIKLVSLNNGQNWHLEVRNWDKTGDYFTPQGDAVYVPTVKDYYMNETAARRQLFNELTANVPVGVDYGTKYNGGVVRPEYQTTFVPGTNPAGRFFHSAFLYPKSMYYEGPLRTQFSGVHYGPNEYEELTIFLKNSPSPVEYSIDTFDVITISEKEVPSYVLRPNIPDDTILRPNDSFGNPSPSTIIGNHISRQFLKSNPMKLLVYESKVPTDSYPTIAYNRYSIYNPHALPANYSYGYNNYSGAYNTCISMWAPDSTQVIINNPSGTGQNNYSRIYSLDTSLTLYGNMNTEYATCKLFGEIYTSPIMGLKRIDVNIGPHWPRKLTDQDRGIPIDFKLTTSNPNSTYVIYSG